MKHSDNNQPVTNKQLHAFMKDLRKDLMKDIEAMFATFGQMIFERFDMQDAELAKKADKTDIARIENKLDATVDKVDNHQTRIKKLEPKPAWELIQ